ncbi:MAG: MFS transporter [Bacteroidaceae bacterium]|nr:MFS transporter [Bacteroidaceae bacterium]
MNIKIRLTLLNFLEFAVWGAYLTSMGSYLASAGMAANIGWFYSVQGFVSLCMPALMGIVADRWVPAQKLLALCHLLAGLFMCGACAYGWTAGEGVEFTPLFTLYSCSVAFFMPTLALSNSVAYTALDKAGLDTVKAFPPIRVFGTIGFIVSMWIVDLGGMQNTALQFGWSGILSIIMAMYALTMPACPLSKSTGKGIVEALGLKAFALFKNYRMAVFFVFSFLLGVCLQITNGFASPFIQSFGGIPEYADTFGVQHANMLISLSQISETLCILLIPFFLGKFGIKRVMMIAMLGWVLRFAFFGLGDPGHGVWLFILSMIVYGVAFDFFNISGSLFVDKETDLSIRNSAQGMFMMMTNGLGATVGTLSAQAVINNYVYDLQDATPLQTAEGWSTCWYIFAAYAMVVLLAFAVLFRYKHNAKN